MPRYDECWVEFHPASLSEGNSEYPVLGSTSIPAKIDTLVY